MGMVRRIITFSVLLRLDAATTIVLRFEAPSVAGAFRVDFCVVLIVVSLEEGSVTST